MCGLFGFFPTSTTSSAPSSSDVSLLVRHSKQRGQDASGLITLNNRIYDIYRSDLTSVQLFQSLSQLSFNCLLGHSRLITDGLGDNQPVAYDDIAVIHNGIIVNHQALFDQYCIKRKYQIDTEILLALSAYHLDCGNPLSELPQFLFDSCQGTLSAAILFKKLESSFCFQTTAVYLCFKDSNILFSSEQFPLTQINCSSISQLRDTSAIFDVPTSNAPFGRNDLYKSALNPSFLPSLPNLRSSTHIEYREHNLRRCKKHSP